MKKVILCVLYSILLTACQSSITIIPDSVSGNGLVVADVAGYGLDELTGADPVINGKTYIGGIRNGKLLLELSPGEYTLEHLNAVLDFVGGYRSYTTTYINYPVKRKFRVEAGKATNLGTLYYYNAPIQQYNYVLQNNRNATGFTLESTNQHFLLQNLDNSSSMRSYLRDNRPDLYKSLQGNKIRLEQGDYLRKDISTVQNAAASYSLSKKFIRKEKIGKYVGGAAGSIGLVGYSNGYPVITGVIKTDEVMDFSQCNGHFDRLICMLSRREYLSVFNNKVSRHKVPGNVEMNSAYITDRATILVDDYFNIYTKLHSGKKWYRYTKAKTQHAVPKDSYAPDAINAFRFSPELNGFYIYAYKQDASEFPVIFTDYRSFSMKKVDVPKSIENIIAINDTERGTYAGLTDTLMSNSELFFKPVNAQAWKRLEIPSESCKDIRFMDEAGLKMEVTCTAKKLKYMSLDGGNTWGYVR